MSGTKPQADVEMVVTSQQALAALDAFGNRFNAMLDKMEQGNKRVKKTSQDTGDAFAQWGISLGKAAASGLGVYGALQSVQTVAGLIRREIDAMLQAQKDAAATTLSFNDAMDRIRYQTNQKGPNSDIGFKEIRERIKASSFDDKVLLADVVRAAISSDVDSPYSTRVQTAIDIAELRPDMRHDRVTMENVVRSVILNKRLFGGSTAQQLGIMDVGISAAAVDDARAFAEYISPIAAELKPLGFTQQESIALGAAYGSVVADFSGPTSRTNLATVMTQIYTEVRKRGLTHEGMDMIKLLQSNTPQGQSIRQYMIGVLEEGLNEEEMQEATAFGAGKTMGRTRGKIPFFNLLQPEGVGYHKGSFKQTLDAALAEIPTLDVSGRMFAEKLAERAADPDYFPTRLGVAGQRFVNSRELDPDMAMRGVASNYIEDILGKTRDFNLRSRFEKFKLMIDSGDMSPEQALLRVQGLAQSRAGEIEGFRNYGYGATREAHVPPFATRMTEADPMSAEEQREVSDLRILATQVSALVEQLKENQKTPQPVVDATPKLKEPAPPAAGGISNQ